MSSPQTWDVRARLVALSPPFQGRNFPIVLFPAVIGRGTECAVFLDTASVSRQHAVIEEKDGRFLIRDLGSRNGIKLADQPIHEAALNAGDVVAIGDVQLRFEPVAEGETAGPKTEGVEPRLLTGQDIVALVQSAPQAGVAAGAEAAAGAPESQSRVGLNMKMVAVVVAALALSAGVGAFILRHSGGAGQGRQGQWPAVMVKVGEKKWIQIASLQYIKLRDDVWWTPMDLRAYEVRDIAVGNPQGPAAPSGDDTGGDSIVSVEKYDPGSSGEILVTGKAVGETTARITLDTGNVLTMRIIVRGRIEDPLEPLLYGRYSAPERVAMAEQFLKNGILIEQEKPYLALQEYQKAKAVLTPLPDNSKGDLYYLQTIPHLAKAQRTVDDRWTALSGQISVANASKDLTTAIDLLQQAAKLIPDPNDPRHQKAQGALRSLIRRQIEEKE